MQHVAVTPGYSLQSEPLLSGDAGVEQTVQRIRQLVDEGKKDPFVNRCAAEIVRATAPQYNDAAEIRAIFEWVLRHIRFVKDPTGKEVLRPAATTLQWGYGDCDDINAILLPSLLGTVGYPVRLITIASHPGHPETFTHVYCEAFLNGRWIPLDAARKDTRFGVEPARQFRKRAWSLATDAHEDLSGLAGMGCACCPAAGVGTHARLGRAYPASGLGTHARLGRMYRAQGLGDFDWGAFGTAVQDATKAVTATIAAARGQLVYPSAGAYPLPAGAPQAGPQTTVTGGITGNTWLLLLFGVGAVALLARR